MPATNSIVTASKPKTLHITLPVVVIMILGSVLAWSALAEFWVGLKAEHVSDLVRPELTDEGLSQHRADFETARQAVHGLSTEVLPAIAQGRGTTPERLRAQIDANYPAVGKLLAQESQIVPFAESSLVNLERQQANFQSADSAPAGWLPAYEGGVFDAGLAALVLGIGVTLIIGRVLNARPAFVALAVIAGLLIVLPLALRIPGKAADAEAVLDSLNPTPAVVQRTEDSILTAHEAEVEFRTKLSPDLAAALGTDQAGFQAAIARQSPATAVALAELPEVLERYDSRLAIRVGGAGDLRFLKRLPVAALGWFGPAFGCVLAAATAWAWWSQRSFEGGSTGVMERTRRDDTP
jgi:hypothetical protein